MTRLAAFSALLTLASLGAGALLDGSQVQGTWPQVVMVAEAAEGVKAHRVELLSARHDTEENLAPQGRRRLAQEAPLEAVHCSRTNE